ncbi:hypothetical protein B5X24_HaOG214957 [Helicoverpa armigera]|uniref:Fibronectin type-III domain-containing protein n=1 Tax=Helicoverpa armigera TaxID=29058 RepID=A0A2W1B152_HELAM|nr:hypothetical protein B5X24_HaOG214957 [Helicoverpa armigera]
MEAIGGISAILKDDTHFLIEYETGEAARLYILNSHVFKYYMSPSGNFLDYPVPNNPSDHAKINIKKITDYETKSFEYSVLETTDEYYAVYTNKIMIRFDKKLGTMTVRDMRNNKEVLKESAPLSHDSNATKQTLYQHKDEYYFGGGMQNGRFTHKGEKIEICNSNNWVDGGVTSPNPFYWSTYGYGILRNTWQPGVYDFGSKDPSVIETTHQGEDFDAFFFINSNIIDILNDYYELTGHPIFMPEYAFYESHLNAFNRDYWVKVDRDTPGAILYEDGLYYKCFQPKEMNGKDGILESLNGEKSNYQFSARAMIGRYQRHDMPLGWFVPNDGYGCGYGQTDSLEGDIENLKQFADYARGKGVECALWTESNLEPANPNQPKKGERDLKKEVAVAGVVALKCDVAWIGAGYSFGLNAVEKAANIFAKAAKHTTRIMIITVDGWAGTQRHAGVWSGDQSGGQWEYIRFHIPTYIGSGLSGIPVVGSDMDGIYGGHGKYVNVRDYQWKTFTPLQLNMDGWGKVQKTPFSFDEEAKRINRAYLKLKSMMMPYNYTIAHESIHGLPMIRAMFLEFPDEVIGYTKDSQYQYMWGPHVLVAPVYKEKAADVDWVRDGVYLPDSDQVWIDFLTGEKYQGGKIWNYLKTPLWRMPVFIKDGAIIPMANPNNNPKEIRRDIRIYNIYPNSESNFSVYEDDGISSEYLDGQHASTKITVIGPQSNESGNLLIHIHKTHGEYHNMVKERSTLLRIMATKTVEHLKVAINDESVQILRVKTEDEFNLADDAYYFQEDFLLNPYLNSFGGDELEQKFLLIKVHKVDVTTSDLHVKIKGFENRDQVKGSNTTVNHALEVPAGFTARDDEVTPTSVTLRWETTKGVYYELERDGVVFTNILNPQFTFEGFAFDSEHKFRVRSANLGGVSKWSYYILISTKEDPQKYAIKNVKVVCNIPCEPSQEVCKLTDGDASSIWHTRWAKPDQANPQKGKVISLNFDLDGIFEIDRLEYTPREDAGNGTILQIQYRHSTDGKVWSSMSTKINWEHDETVKNIPMQGIKMRFIELNILDTIGGFGSGKHILFYKKD